MRSISESAKRPVCSTGLPFVVPRNCWEPSLAACRWAETSVWLPTLWGSTALRLGSHRLWRADYLTHSTRGRTSGLFRSLCWGGEWLPRLCRLWWECGPNRRKRAKSWDEPLSLWGSFRLPSLCRSFRSFVWPKSRKECGIKIAFIVISRCGVFPLRTAAFSTSKVLVLRRLRRSFGLV